MDIFEQIKAHDILEEQLDKAREELQNKLFPVIRAMGRVIGYNEKLVGIYASSTGVNVRTEDTNNLDSDHYSIPRHVMESEYPIEAAKALHDRELIRRQEADNEQKRATIRRLSEELRQLQGEDT